MPSMSIQEAFYQLASICIEPEDTEALRVIEARMDVLLRKADAWDAHCCRCEEDMDCLTHCCGKEE